MKRIIRILVLATLLNVVFVCYTFADTINIPADYITIQAGINASTNGDTVLVQPGTYIENINYNGKNITVGSLFLTTADTSYISQTIIDGDSVDSVVKFENGEDTTAVLNGFTIQNGSASYGGGIYCHLDSSPNLVNLTIIGNTAYEYTGGGICCMDNCNPNLVNVTISGNSASSIFYGWGGGIYCYNSSPNLMNVTISNNTSTDGGGVYCYYSNPSLVNVTVNGNSANDTGGGIYCYWESSPILENVTISNNTAIHYGGGIFGHVNSSLSLKNLTIIGNTAYEHTGGGICCMDNCNINLENVTITSNSANDTGGGIYCDYSSILNFSSENRCNIYSNTVSNGRGYGADILAISSYVIDVIVDTFTVMTPNDYYASPINNFIFDILHSIYSLINSDVYVSISGDNNNSGTSPDEPFKTIKYALSRIYSDSMNVNTIHLGEGIFSNSTNGETFPLHWSNYVNLAGSGENETILDANNTSGVMKLDYVNDVIIEHITITNGNANMGGGIYCWNSSPILQNVTITGNSYAYDGGGIYCDNACPILENVTITNNSVSCDGGGIFCKNNSAPSLNNVIITGNSASKGGGICCRFNSSPNLINVIITGNSASFDGGGIDCEFESSPSLKNVTITGNSAGFDGGGIDCEQNSSPILENVTITDNIAYYGNGGGISCYDDSYPSFDKVTITNNIACVDGGGIYCKYQSSPNIINSIVSDNTGNYGIYVYSDNPTITYSNFYNNEGGNFYGVNDSLGVNVSTNANGDSCDAFYNIQLDPLFVDPLNGDYHLSWVNYPIPDSTKSPCIDAGDPNSPPDPDGTVADMGAFYFNQNVSVDDPQEISNYMLTNYPNPISSNFNDLTVSFAIHKPGKVKVQLFNIRGQMIATLIDEDKNIGDYTISHSVNDLSSGIYFTKMSIDGIDKEIKKVVLLR